MSTLKATDTARLHHISATDTTWSEHGRARGTTGAMRALARANLRYWPTVVPRVRAELARWHTRAQAIPDPEGRALALGKLKDERFNPRLAATLATLAPKDRRGQVIEAIVALQLAYDYLDALTERPTGDPDPVGAYERAHRPFVAPFAADVSTAEKPPPSDERAIPGEEYVQELTRTVTGALARLPRWQACAPAAKRAAERCAQAQALAHAAPQIGIEPARRWGEERSARPPAQPPGPWGWREALVAGQSSVLNLHALIATAARADLEMDAAQADALDRAYEYVGAMTMLDGLVDREHDSQTGAISYPALYDGTQEMGAALRELAREGLRHMRGVRDGAHHAVTLTGVVAGYAAHPNARERPARDVFETLERELRARLGAVMPATSLLMRVWRRTLDA